MKDIEPKNSKNQYHGYQEWYSYYHGYQEWYSYSKMSHSKMSHRGNWKNNRIIGYAEWHRFNETFFYII